MGQGRSVGYHGPVCCYESFHMWYVNILTFLNPYTGMGEWSVLGQLYFK